MRNLTASQAASFNGELLTIASLLTIYVNDGTIVMLTDHDQDLGAWSSAFGAEISNIVMQLGGGGQTATVTMLPDRGNAGGITYPMIEGGLLDSCMVKCFWVDWNKLPLDPIQIFEGYVSEAKYGNSSLLELTVNSLLSVPRSLCGDNMSQTCRADFGDDRCKVDITPLVDGPHVFAAADAQSFVMTRDEVTPPGFYNNGTCYFKSGSNKGLGYEVLTVSVADSDGRETIYLKVPLAFDVVQGDYFLLYPGCDKVITSGCTYWNNTANFQGEPFIADQSDILPPESSLTTKATGINTGMPAVCNWWLTQYIKIGFGVTLLFAPGTRAADNVKTQRGIHYYNDTMIPSDAYTAIYNVLGSTDKVLAYDGTLTPIDTTAQANLVAAGYKVPLNLTVSDILIDDPETVSQVELQYMYNFFQLDTPAIYAALKSLGFDPVDLVYNPTVQNTVVAG